MGDYDWIAPLIGAIGKGVNSYASGEVANQQALAAYEEMLRNLRERFADYDGLGSAGYVHVAPEQLGPSALESIQLDPAARQAQLEALGGLDDLSAHGGLTLADLQALNELQANLNRNDVARRKGLANEYAARGQLGAGAQLAMDLTNQQNAAQTASERSQGIAAQAQARALQALLEKGRMARGMSEDEYRRKSDAARARDLIEAQNARYRTDAGRYNNSLRGQAYDDRLAQARGKTELTKGMNEVVFGRGKQQANTTLAQGGYRNDLIDQAGTAFDAAQDEWDSSSDDVRDQESDDERDY